MEMQKKEPEGGAFLSYYF